MHQKSKEEFWIDETGIKIPYNRTTKLERLRENKSKQITTKALNLNKALKAFKDEMFEVCSEIFDESMTDLNSKANIKGNFTWFNFDRTAKIETSVSERIEFDDASITACKNLLDEFISENVESKVEFVRELVNDAFSTSRGKLDAKKVMGLLKYRSKIKNDKFQRALDLLEGGIRRSSSKTYYRIWIKDDSGQFVNIDLNFSSI